MKQYDLMNPMVDFAFKALFGEKDDDSKFLLISFLNAVLNFSNEEKIVEIVYLNPYNDKEYKDDKLSIMDIKVKTQNDELIDIEVQINDNQNFRKRSLYYWSKMYSDTIKSGENYEELKKCVVLSLLDFKLIDETEKYHTIFRIKEVEEDFELLEDLEIHYLETPKFAEQNANKTDIEKWMTFMKIAGDKSKRNILEKVRTESEVIDMAVNKLEELSQDEKRRQAYYAREKALLDEKSKAAYFKNKVERARLEAMKKGMEQGKKEGIKKGVVNTAKNLIKMGITINQVMQATGLSEQEVINIKSKIDKENH